VREKKTALLKILSHFRIGREKKAEMHSIAGACMRKISLGFIFGMLLMTNNICHAGCTQEAALPLDAFKGHIVFVWKEDASYFFTWMRDKNALISREELVKNTPVVAECVIIRQIKKMRDLGKKQFIKFVTIENPKFSSFLDKEHKPRRYEEEFHDLISRLRSMPETNDGVIEIRFSSADNAKLSNGF
jgi:hypothetical protein